jgi:hypothetical protein
MRLVSNTQAGYVKFPLDVAYLDQNRPGRVIRLREKTHKTTDFQERDRLG